VAFFAFVHLALFLALYLSPGNSLVSSWCEAQDNFLALTVSNTRFVKNPLICFTLLPMILAESFSVLSSHRRQDVFFYSFSIQLLQLLVAKRVETLLIADGKANRSAAWRSILPTTSWTRPAFDASNAVVHAFNIS